MQQSVGNVCANLKVDPLSRFCTGACQVFTNQKRTRERSEAVPSACNYNFIKKETLSRVFSCEFREISKNTFSNRTPRVAATERWKIVKPITMQRNFFTQVTGNRVSHHYALNVIKVFV